MSKSFVAPQQERRNPHQNPVRSHKGGYLRCPFNITSSYAELAEKRVHEDLARGGRVSAVVADKDGVMSSLTGLQVDRDEIDGGSGGRPWCRAGVGASRLSGREKRAQQEQAELIYGRGALAGYDDTSAASGAVSARGELSQEHLFGLHARDRAALQRVIPRATSETVKRRRVEGVRKELLSLGHHRHCGSAPLHTNSAADREPEAENDVEGNSEGHRLASPHARTPFPPPAPGASRNGASVLPCSSGSKGDPSGADAAAERSSRSGPSDAQLQCASRQAPTMPIRPKNRMQMLDDLRAQALMRKGRHR
ncbi:hypothetical protein LSCM1_03758 [Leishmania martiniquensis]|uniref:Uncharacterized protein n=1 Tax=Leishmania martiniquensis TaxID=1580590 RepID=A0A836GHQ6_9TRYP|nr:hypothetical protein LSCM1_03758 [Leishmania martiniquensis]